MTKRTKENRVWQSYVYHLALKQNIILLSALYSCLHFAMYDFQLSESSDAFAFIIYNF